MADYRVDLSTKLGNVKILNPLMNASGVMCTELGDLHKLNTSSSGAFISKSCTLLSRKGNPEPRYYSDPSDNCLSINSMGIPNHGYQYYIDAYSKINPDKPYSISISGMSWDENSKLLSIMKDSPVDWVELNVSCPNIIGKPQLGYDFEGFREITRKVAEIWDEPYKKGLGLKLPPYFDFAHFNEAADIIKDCQPTIRFITCCNSFGNGMVVDHETESTVIRPKDGFGGVGGQNMKPTGLANVRKFYTLLKDDDIDIIGCGGIQSGKDVFEYVLCGANLVQIGTHLYDKGVGVFDNINLELKDIMMKKGYSSLDDFKGKLRTI
jgi:dihydroorotate dehydrogenase (fumarate)